MTEPWLDRFVVVRAIKTHTTDALDTLASRPRGRWIARMLGAFVPDDWGNYFS